MSERGYDSDSDSGTTNLGSGAGRAGSLASGIGRVAYNTLYWVSSSLSGAGQRKQLTDKPREEKGRKKRRTRSKSHPNRLESLGTTRKQEFKIKMPTQSNLEVIAPPQLLWDCLPYKENQDNAKEEMEEEDRVQEKFKEWEFDDKKGQLELVAGAANSGLGKAKKWNEEDSSDDSAFGSMRRLNVLKDCMELGRGDQWRPDPTQTAALVYTAVQFEQCWTLLDAGRVEQVIKESQVRADRKDSADKFFKYLRNKRNAMPGKNLVGSQFWLADVWHGRLRKGVGISAHRGDILELELENKNCSENCNDCPRTGNKAVIKFNPNKDQLQFCWQEKELNPPDKLGDKQQDYFTSVVSTYKDIMLQHRESELYLRNRIRVNNQRQLNAEWQLDTEDEEEDENSSNSIEEGVEESVGWPLGLTDLLTADRVQAYFLKLAKAANTASGIQNHLRQEEVATLEFKRMAGQLKFFIDEYRDGTVFITLVKGLRQQNQGHPAVKEVVQSLQVKHDEYVGHLGEMLDLCTDRASEMYFAGQFVKPIGPRLPDSTVEEVGCEDVTDVSSHGSAARRPLTHPEPKNIGKEGGSEEYYMDFPMTSGAGAAPLSGSKFPTSSPVVSRAPTPMRPPSRSGEAEPGRAAGTREPAEGEHILDLQPGPEIQIRLDDETGPLGARPPSPDQAVGRQLGAKPKQFLINESQNEASQHPATDPRSNPGTELGGIDVTGRLPTKSLLTQAAGTAGGNQWDLQIGQQTLQCRGGYNPIVPGSRTAAAQQTEQRTEVAGPGPRAAMPAGMEELLARQTEMLKSELGKINRRIDVLDESRASSVISDRSTKSVRSRTSRRSRVGSEASTTHRRIQRSPEAVRTAQVAETNPLDWEERGVAASAAMAAVAHPAEVLQPQQIPAVPQPGGREPPPYTHNQVVDILGAFATHLRAPVGVQEMPPERQQPPPPYEPGQSRRGRAVGGNSGTRHRHRSQNSPISTSGTSAADTDTSRASESEEEEEVNCIQHRSVSEAGTNSQQTVISSRAARGNAARISQAAERHRQPVAAGHRLGRRPAAEEEDVGSMIRRFNENMEAERRERREEGQRREQEERARAKEQERQNQQIKEELMAHLSQLSLNSKTGETSERAAFLQSGQANPAGRAGRPGGQTGQQESGAGRAAGEQAEQQQPGERPSRPGRGQDGGGEGGAAGPAGGRAPDSGPPDDGDGDDDPDPRKSFRKEEGKRKEDDLRKEFGGNVIKEEIFILDEEYQELLDNRVELLQHGQLVLDRQQVVSNISADVTPQRALDKLGRPDFANIELLDHVVKEVRNRSDALVLHYRLNNNLDKDAARQTTDKLGDVMGSIKAEIQLMRDQGLDLTRHEIENLADVVLTSRSKADMSKVTSSLTRQLAEWVRVMENIMMINRRYVNGRSLHAEFSIHRVQLIMQALDPAKEGEPVEQSTKMFSVRAVALDYMRALYNTHAGIALMAKAKHVTTTKLSTIVETAALNEYKEAKNKLSDGKRPNIYSWRKRILTHISQFGVAEENQPKVILAATTGQAADVIKNRVDRKVFKTGNEVIAVLLNFFGNKEELVDQLASRHIEIGMVCTETAMQDRHYDLHTLLSLREKRLRDHQEAIEEMDHLLEDEEINKKKPADLLTPRYMKSLRGIFPKETLKTAATKRIDKMELLNLLKVTLKRECDEAVDELHDIPPDLMTKSAESTRAFFGLENGTEPSPVMTVVAASGAASGAAPADGLSMEQLFKKLSEQQAIMEKNLQKRILDQRGSNTGRGGGTGGGRGGGRGGGGRGRGGTPAGAGTGQQAGGQWDQSVLCKPCRGKDKTIKYHSTQEESNSCKNWLHYHDNPDKWFDLCLICYRTLRKNNITLEDPIIHYQEEGYSKKYSCPHIVEKGRAEAARVLREMGICCTCTSSVRGHTSYNNYDQTTNTCTRNTTEPCQAAGCKYNLLLCTEHHNENTAKLQEFKDKLAKFDIQLNVALPVLTEINDKDAKAEAAQRALPINFTDKPFLKKREERNTEVDKLLGQDNRGLSSVVQIEGKDGSPVTLMFDTGCQSACFAERVAGTTGGLEGEAPCVDKVMLLSGLTGQTITTYGIVININLNNQREVLKVPGSMTSNMPSIQYYYLNNHLDLVKQEAKKRGMDIDYIPALADHGGKIDVVLGTIYEAHYPEIVYQSPTGFRITKSRVSTGRYTPYAAAGVFPTLQTLRESVDNMASIFEGERLFTLQHLRDNEEEVEGVEEIEPKRENNHYCSQELAELGKICSETPEEMLGDVLHLRGDDILYESKVFHCIPQERDFISMDVIHSTNVEEFLQWRLDNTKHIKVRLQSSKERVKAVISALSSTMHQTFKQQLTFAKELQFDDFLNWLELQMVVENKSTREEAELAMAFMAEEREVERGYEQNEEVFYSDEEEDDEERDPEEALGNEDEGLRPEGRGWKQLPKTFTDLQVGDKKLKENESVGHWEGGEMFEEEDEEDEDEWLFRNHNEDMNTFTEQEWKAANLKPDPEHLEVASMVAVGTDQAGENHSFANEILDDIVDKIVNKKDDDEEIIIFGTSDSEIPPLQGWKLPDGPNNDKRSRATGLARELRAKLRPEKEQTTILQLLQYYEDILVADYQNVAKCVGCTGCARCRSPDVNLKLSISKLEENLRIRQNLWLDHEKGRVYFRYALKDNWHKNFVCNKAQAFQNAQSIIKQCKRIGPEVWPKVHDKYMDFLAKGHMAYIEDIEEWPQLMENCNKKWVEGGLFALFTIVHKLTSLSTKYRPAVDLKRPGPRGYSLNEFSESGSSCFSMLRFAVECTLFPHFGTADHSQYYNSLWLVPEQLPLYQVIVPNRAGELGPGTMKVAALKKGWYGATPTGRACIEAKERILEAAQVPDQCSSYVDDIGYGAGSMQKVKNTLGNYLDTMEEFGFANKGCLFSRETPPANLVDENGNAPLMGFHYHPATDSLQILPKMVHAEDTKKTKVLKKEQVFHGSSLAALIHWQERLHPEFTLKMQTSQFMHYWSPNGLNAPLLTGMKNLNRQAIFLAKKEAVRQGKQYKNGRYFDFVLPKQIVNEHLRFVFMMKTFESYKFPRCAIKPNTLKDPENTPHDLHLQVDGAMIANHALAHTYHKLNNGKHQANFACSNISLSKLKSNTVENGPKPQSQARQEVESAVKGATVAKSLSHYLNGRGLQEKILFSDSATAVHLIVSKTAKLDQYLLSRIATIREVFKEENIYWVPGAELAADCGTRPVEDPELCGPNSRFYRGMKWQQEGLSLEQAEKKMYIIKATNISKIYDEEFSRCAPEDLRNLSEEEINEKLRVLGAKERTGTAGLSLVEKKEFLLQKAKEESEKEKMEIQKMKHKTRKDTSNIMDQAEDKTLLKMEDVEKGSERIEEEGDKGEEDSLPDLEQDEEVEMDPVPYQVLPALQNNCAEPEQTAKQFLVSNILKQRFDKVVATTAMLFKAVHNWLWWVHSGRPGTMPPEDRQIFRKFTTQKQFLCDLVFYQPAGHEFPVNAIPSAYSQMKLRRYMRRPPALVVPPPLALVKYIKDKREKNGVKKVKVLNVKNWQEAIDVIFRANWGRYPGVTRIVRCGQLLRKPSMWEDEEIIQRRFNAACIRTRSLARSNKHKTDSRQRPGITQLGRLLTAYLLDSVKTLPEEEERRFMEFSQVGELGWKNKEEETREKLVKYWTEEAVRFQTDHTEALLLPYYIASHCNLKVYRKLGELHQYTRMATKYIVYKTQQAHLAHLSEKERNQIGRVEEDILISHRKLRQDVSMVELLDPQTESQWEALRWLTAKAEVVYLPRGSLLVLLLLDFIHHHVRAGPFFLGMKTRHKGLRQDLTIARCHFESHGLTPALQYIKKYCKTCQDQKDLIIHRLYGSLKYELMPNYQVGDAVQLDLFGPVLTLPAEDNEVGGRRPPKEIIKYWYLAAVCVVTHVVKIKVLEKRSTAHLENALSMIMHAGLRPRVVLSDQESGVVKLLTSGEYEEPNLTFGNGVKHNFEFKVVGAQDHRQNGIIEGIFKKLRRMIHSLDLKRFHLPLSFAMRAGDYLAELHNSTPMAVRTKKSSTLFETISPNTFLGRFNRGECTGPITIPEDVHQLTELTNDVYRQINTLYRTTFFTAGLSPTSGFVENQTEIAPGDVIAFNDQSSFHPVKRYARVEEIVPDRDGQGRNALVTMVGKYKTGGKGGRTMISYRHLRGAVKLPTYNVLQDFLDEKSLNWTDHLAERVTILRKNVAAKQGEALYVEVKPVGGAPKEGNMVSQDGQATTSVAQPAEERFDNLSCEQQREQRAGAKTVRFDLNPEGDSTNIIQQFKQLTQGQWRVDLGAKAGGVSENPGQDGGEDSTQGRGAPLIAPGASQPQLRRSPRHLSREHSNITSSDTTTTAMQRGAARFRRHSAEPREREQSQVESCNIGTEGDVEFDTKASELPAERAKLQMQPRPPRRRHRQQTERDQSPTGRVLTCNIEPGAQPLQGTAAERMLIKFGFRAGSGLGKSGQGISQPLRFEQTTEGAGRIVNIDKDDPNMEHTLVPLLKKGKRGKSKLPSIAFVPAPENTELRPLPTRTEEDEMRIKQIQEKYLTQQTTNKPPSALAAATAPLPTNPYFNLKKRRVRGRKSKGRPEARVHSTISIESKTKQLPTNPYFNAANRQRNPEQNIQPKLVRTLMIRQVSSPLSNTVICRWENEPRIKYSVVCLINKWAERLASGSSRPARTRAAKYAASLAVKHGRDSPPRGAAARPHKLEYSGAAQPSVVLASLQWRQPTQLHLFCCRMAGRNKASQGYGEVFGHLWKDVQNIVDKARERDFDPKLFGKEECNMCTLLQDVRLLAVGCTKTHNNDWERVGCPSWAHAMEEISRVPSRAPYFLLNDSCREEFQIRAGINLQLGNKFATLLANLSNVGNQQDCHQDLTHNPCVGCHLAMNKVVLHKEIEEAVNCKSWWKLDVLFQLMEPAFTGPQAWAATALLEAVGNAQILMLVLRQLAARAALETYRMYMETEGQAGHHNTLLARPRFRSRDGSTFSYALPNCSNCFISPQTHICFPQTRGSAGKTRGSTKTKTKIPGSLRFELGLNPDSKTWAQKREKRAARCNHFTNYWNRARRMMEWPEREMMVARVAYRRVYSKMGDSLFFQNRVDGPVVLWPQLHQFLQVHEPHTKHSRQSENLVPGTSWSRAVMELAPIQIQSLLQEVDDPSDSETDLHEVQLESDEELVEEPDDTEEILDETDGMMEILRRPAHMAMAPKTNFPECENSIVTKEEADSYFDLPFTDAEEAAYKYLADKECMMCREVFGTNTDTGTVHYTGWDALACRSACRLMMEYNELGKQKFFAQHPKLNNWAGWAEIAQRTELNSLIREFMREMMTRAARGGRDKRCRSCEVRDGAGAGVEHETDEGVQACQNVSFFAMKVVGTIHPTNAKEGGALVELTNSAAGWAQEILAEVKVHLGYHVPRRSTDRDVEPMKRRTPENEEQQNDPEERRNEGSGCGSTRGRTQRIQDFMNRHKCCVTDRRAPTEILGGHGPEPETKTRQRKKSEDNCKDDDGLPSYQEAQLYRRMEEGKLFEETPEKQQDWDEETRCWHTQQACLRKGLCGLGQLGMVVLTILMLTNPHLAAELPEEKIPNCQERLVQQLSYAKPPQDNIQNSLTTILIVLISSMSRAVYPEVLLLVTSAMPLAVAEEEEIVELAVPMWADAKEAVTNPKDGTTILPSWRAAVAFDTSGKFSGIKPTISLLPLVEEESCEAEEPAFKDPIRVRAQVVHVREHQDVTVVVCSGTFSYDQLFCSVGFYSHREAPITVMPETRVELSAEQCRQMYYKGSAVVSVYESNKKLGNEVDTVVFVSGLQNGTTNKVDLVAGYEGENNACTGQAFNFRGKHFKKNMLYRKTKFSIYTYTGQYYDRMDEVAIKNLVDIPAGQDHVVDEKYGTVVLMDSVVRKKERCRRATELFTSIGEFHPRQRDQSKGVLFIKKKKKDGETTFVVTGRIKACERIIWQTSVKSVYIVPLFEDNQKLEVMMQDEPDMVAEVEHQLAATAAATVYQMNNNLQKVRENACQMNRAAKRNTRTALMAADNSQLANIILGGMASYAGAAFSVVMGAPIRVNFMNYRPTADTNGVCCEEIPVTFLDRMQNRVFAFMKAISRVLVEYCSPVPCSSSHPMVQAMWGEEAVRAVMTDNNNTTWTWPKVMRAGKAGTSENQMFYMCDVGDGSGFKYCKIPKRKLWLEKELTLQVGYDHVMDNLVSTIWDPESEEMLYKIQQDMSNHAVLHRELSSTANGHIISGGLMGKLIDNAPDKVKEDVWTSFLSYNTLTNKKSVAYKLLMGVVVSAGLIVLWILAVCCCNTYGTIQLAFYNLWLSCKNCTKRKIETDDEENFPMVARRHKNLCHDIDSCLELIAKLEQNEIRNDRRLAVLEDKVKQGAGLLAMHCEQMLPSAPPESSNPTPPSTSTDPANAILPAPTK